MTEIIIVAKKSRLVIPRFFAPDTAILSIANVGNDDDGHRIFFIHSRRHKSLKNIVEWRPVVVNVV